MSFMNLGSTRSSFNIVLVQPSQAVAELPSHASHEIFDFTSIESQKGQEIAASSNSSIYILRKYMNR